MSNNNQLWRHLYGNSRKKKNNFTFVINIIPFNSLKGVNTCFTGVTRLSLMLCVSSSISCIYMLLGSTDNLARSYTNICACTLRKQVNF